MCRRHCTNAAGHTSTLEDRQCVCAHASATTALQVVADTARCTPVHSVVCGTKCGMPVNDMFAAVGSTQHYPASRYLDGLSAVQLLLCCVTHSCLWSWGLHLSRQVLGVELWRGSGGVGALVCWHESSFRLQAVRRCSWCRHAATSVAASLSTLCLFCFLHASSRLHPMCVHVHVSMCPAVRHTDWPGPVQPP